MWRRAVRIGPRWLFRPIHKLNGLIPGGAAHEIGETTAGDRDVRDLLERCPPHLEFTGDGECRGVENLRRLGIPNGAKFVCVVARDNAYFRAMYPQNDYSYHDYRDADIGNYVLAAQTLAERDYYVNRMGAVVNAPLKSTHPKIIDYATSGRRTVFLDIYIGAKCFSA